MDLHSNKDIKITLRTEGRSLLDGPDNKYINNQASSDPNNKYLSLSKGVLRSPLGRNRNPSAKILFYYKTFNPPQKF